MGEYAEMAINQGFAEIEQSFEDGDFEPFNTYYRKTQNTNFHHYRVFEILNETDKAFHVLFAREDTSEPWIKSFWWPKSQVTLYENGVTHKFKMLMVPDWLIKQKLNEG